MNLKIEYERTPLQEQAFQKFSKLKVGALFMKMGTGKTRVAVDLVNHNNCDLLLYVCPFTVMKNAKDELDKWELKTPHKIVAYETISMSDQKYIELLSEIESLHNDGKIIFIIADESIFIKNESAKRTARLKNIRKYCKYALILNGTPLTRDEWDVYNQMDFLSPLILNMSADEFRNTFFTHIYGRKNGRKIDFYKFSKVNAEALYKMIEPYVIYSNMAVNDYNKIWYSIDTKNDKYLEYKQEKLMEMVNNCSFNEIMALLTKLRYIATMDENKMDALVRNISNKQVIVYCSFIEEVKYIANKIDCYVIIGRTKNREVIIEQFKNDNKPLIMTLGVGAYGLNLQFCSNIVFSSITFDYGKIEQAQFRVNRLGQDNEINIEFFVADLGINDIMRENLSKKANLKKIIEDHIRKGDVMEWLKSI